MLRVLSLFSGIGAFEKALERLNIEHEVVAYCEIDKYASKAYSIIHDIPESKNLVDVTKVDILDVEETVDLITYGFPCQDISAAGKQKGFTDEEGNRTRSGLFFEALRIIDDYRPKFAIAENVKALVGKKFSEEFKTVLESLEEVGYNNYYAVLNAKDYGIPQNRERVFIISIRKDIDKGFTFPEAVPLTLRLKDMLEDQVDERYYLSDKTIATRIEHARRNRENGRGFGWVLTDGSGVTNTIQTKQGRASDVYVVEEDDCSRTKRIRRLTPIECYKLMGFDAEDCKKCFEAGISNTQLYKQAGNSIVVNVLDAIFSKLGETYDEFRRVGG